MARIRSELLVDGVVFVATDWSVLGRAAMLNLPKVIITKKWEDSNVKGINCLKRRRLTRIPIGSCNGLALWLLCASENQTQIMNWTRVREAFIAAVDYAISRMRNTRTRAHWYARHCNTYKKYTGKEKCQACEDQLLTIFPGEVEQFGKFLQEKLDSDLEDLNYASMLCAMQLGQSSPVEDVFPLLKTFALEAADEVVLHLARDFLADNKCLLWNREKVVRALGAPTVEFYPCFIGGHGNFTYDLNQQQQQQEEDVDTEVRTHSIKCYSDNFKEVHRSNPVPFQSPIATNILSNQVRGFLTADKLLGWLEAVERCSTELKNKKRVVARVEAILCIQNPHEEQDCLEDFVQFFEEFHGEERKQLLTMFDFSNFEQQLLQTLNPAVSKLTSIVDESKHNYGMNGISIVSLEIANLAAVCEMLISFAIYGKLNHWHGHGDRYNRELIELLRLRAETFRSADWQFRGLGFINCIQLVESELLYNGPLIITKDVLDSFQTEVGDDKVHDVLLAINELRRGNVQSQDEAISTIIEILWDAVVYFTKDRLFPSCDHSQIRLDNVANRIPTLTLEETMGSQQFVSYLTANVILDQKSVQRVLNGVKEAVSSATFQQFKDQFAKFIEKELWKSSLSFVYPTNDDPDPGLESTTTYYLIMFSTGVHNFGFSHLSNDGKANIIKAYSTAFRQFFRTTALPDNQIGRHLERAERLGWGHIKTVHQILTRMFSDWYQPGAREHQDQSGQQAA